MKLFLKRLVSLAITASLAMSVATVTVSAQWKKFDKGWCYQKNDGSYATWSWLKIGEKWYSFDKEGYMETGWMKDGSQWYFLNQDGSMKIGWLKWNNNWYYFTSNGKMATGKVHIDGREEYFTQKGVWEDESLYYIENELSEREAIDKLTSETITVPELPSYEPDLDGAE